MKRALFFTLALAATAAQARLLDDFRDVAAWKATASEQVQARLARDADGSLCLHYDFAGVSGYAVIRRALPVDWPPAFELVARIKGGGATNDLQVKLVDASGENVWWVNRPNHALPARLAELKLKRRHFSFAWGPTPDRALARTEAIEFTIAAGREGGRGSLCVARLELRERAPDPERWPEPVESFRAGALELDFQVPREFNGLALRWPGGVGGFDYEVLASDDGARWRALRSVRASDGGLDALWLPEQEARWLRVRTAANARPAVELRDHTQWPDFNAVLGELARAAPRGHLPRAFLGEQNYWTLVGVDGGGPRSALLSEDGAIEIGRGGFSVEPALRLEDGSLVTWADVQISHSLRDGYLPLPAVHWRHDAFALDIEAAADGPREAPQLLVRYVLANHGTRERAFTLLLAVRPWQVNPPQQFLNTPGGTRPIERLRWRDRVLAVDGRPTLRTSEPVARATALAFDGGVSLDALLAAPALGELTDEQSHASALLAFRVVLAPGERRTIGWTAPFANRGSMPGAVDAATLDLRFAQAAERWRERLNRVVFALPASAQPIADTLRTAVAHILMSRDGPALKPGTRAYARTWIRDGAMMVAALLRMGEVDAAREFVDWFSGFVFDSGKVPCCVDARGADPVTENDSHGQYLYAVAEVWRHTRDQTFLGRHWPIAQRVVDHLERLRQSERGARNREPGREHLFGLMPPSISHEGYSDKPAYSYWDGFWALRGYKDAVVLALVRGDSERALRWHRWGEEFARELAASIEAAARHHRIGFIAGAADRGDFDATATTVALDPAQAAVPRALLDATFERYWRNARDRAEGRAPWTDYTPYELRSIGAFVRMGQPARAHAMLDFFFADRRPAGWNQWAEAVMREYRQPKFLGDMPHAWVGSDYVRSALDLFAYENEADMSLVIGAGWKREWLDEGLAVRGLATAYGVLDMRLDRVGSAWRFTLERPLPGARGGVRLVWPGEGPLPKATLNGRALTWNGRTLALPATASSVTLLPQ
ncbi:MAG: hypothetical protein AMXMBFR72_11230 [Betaproteobacteria bacterium]